MHTMHTTYDLSFVNVDAFNTNEHFQPKNYAWPAVPSHDEFGEPTGYSDWNNEYVVSFTDRWTAVHYARLIAKYFDASVIVTKRIEFTCEHGMSADLCYGPNHYEVA